MFYSRPLGVSADAAVVDQPTSAANVFAAELVKEQENAKAWVASKPAIKDDTTLICNSMLVIAYEGAVMDTLHWGKDHSAVSQFVFGQTDEEGKFEITVPPKTGLIELGVPHDNVYVARVNRRV